MFYKNVFLSTVLFLFGYITLYAQTERVNLSGTVYDAQTGEALPYVIISIKELDQWSSSDNNGNFSFKELKKGEYLLLASCLGYKDCEVKINLSRDITKYVLKLEEQTLQLKEVTVTATSGDKLNSASSINKTALEHVQATSISDVMQLLPGVLTVNPDLSAISKLTIRDVTGKDAANAFGTAIILDGARVSNDANMQLASTAISSQGINTSATTGLDARQITVDNIESIEVIRGVASAEYGDLNSGMVLVTTKAGKSPLEVRFKTDPRIKQVYAGKGFPLGKNKGFLNVDGDYSSSYTDTRTPSKSYNRVTGQIGYSNVFMLWGKSFSLNAKLRQMVSLDKVKRDPDKQSEEWVKAEDRETGLNVYGNWLVKKPWLTNIKYTFAGTIGKQLNEDYTQHSTVGPITTNAMVSGEHVAGFLPYAYYSNLKIEGKPIFLQAKLTANISGKYRNTFNHFIYGIEAASKGNEGNGKSFDPANPPSQNIRPRSFKGHYITEYSGFAEDKIKISVGEMSIDLSAGSRFTKVKSKNLDFGAVVDPRLNARFTLIDRNPGESKWQNLSIRAGWGIQHKMPPLAYLYPDQAYVDRASFTYKDDANNHRLSVVTTHVAETDNKDLKIPKSRNIEFGIDFKAFGIKGSLVYFNEKLTQGYNLSRYAIPFQYKEYTYTPAMVHPEYINGEVVDQGSPVGYRTLQTFNVFQRPNNGVKTDKWGIEYLFDFGRIEALRTSVLMDGAYFHTKSTNNSLDMFQESTLINNEPYPYVGIFAGSTSVNNGSLYERLNTNLRLVTHIPQLRLVFTLVAQCVWMDNQKNISDFNGKRLAYMKDENGNIVEGDIYKNTTYNKFINPVAYMSRDGVIHPFTSTEAQDPLFQHMIKSSRATSFMEDKRDPYFMLNLRMTKEIDRYATLSFYANNLTNSRPWMFYNSSGSYFRVNTEISFGAEITVKF